MPELKSTLADAKGRLDRAWQRSQYRGIRARLATLEVEMQESRQLNRRVAELTDLVAELLVPLARREDETVDALVADYRKGI